jgi:hypothetical protein
MPSSTALRQQIESAFQHRYPSVLTPAPRTIREVQPTGIIALDELLNGGLPVGAITELTGPASSGRTSIALSFLATRTQEGSVCAWIDANDAFDPESAAANGISLRHLLWVRCTNTSPSPTTNDSSPKSFSQKPHHSYQAPTRPWTRLDQALRATDLLLQSGGFASIILDLADESPDHARRIPLATWFRFRQAADRTRCSLIVLGKIAYAQSSAAVVLECEQSTTESANNTVLRGFTFRARRKRERFSPIASSVTSIDRNARKPPASTWSVPSASNAARRA